MAPGIGWSWYVKDGHVDFFNRIHFECIQFVLNMHRKYPQEGYCKSNDIVFPAHTGKNGCHQEDKQSVVV